MGINTWLSLIKKEHITSHWEYLEVLCRFVAEHAVSDKNKAVTLRSAFREITTDSVAQNNSISAICLKPIYALRDKCCAMRRSTKVT